ncbi:MAG: hypothetical protein DRJ33_03125 [Candidatus Methanomethylicota archaeon]|uniref:Radical SAM core domain-containing protein n=1 Tax=Thermoproteota archaeon TaxID=2056631 RepID=A0A497F178_9CREN|nr:MAG: hypothetical protein DRJ33_03125 [Candidatus Verstraetearchaeota archaeon]
MSRRAPESLVWLVTSKCVLNCKHCYASLYRLERDLDLQDVFKVLEEAVEIGVEHVHFTGGEPLLRSDILDVLGHALNLGLEASLFTNLMILNEEVAEKLSKLEIPIYTSLEGPNKEVFEALRGRGTWTRFIENFKTLVKAGVKPHVNIAVSKLNWMYASDSIKKALELGSSSTSIIPVMPSGNAQKFNTHVDSASFAYALRQVASVAEELGIAVAVWCAPFAKAVVNSKRLRYGNCKDWDVLDITPSGNVVACDVMDYKLGNVVEHGLRGAWLRRCSDPLMERALNPRLRPPCDTCSIRSWCMGGCYARAWIAYGDVEAPDPLCPIAAERCLQH